MAFKIGELKEAQLGGGALAKILGAVVVPAKAWTKHVGKLGKGAGAKTCKALAAALGHEVPAEIEEWLDVEGAKGIPEPYDSGWYVGLDLEVPAKGAKAAAKALSQRPLFLLTGLVPFGRDASGDQVFVSVRPHPLGLAEPVSFSHENGEVEDIGARSIADFLVDKWVSDDDPEDDDEDARPGNLGAKAYKPIAAARKAFHARVKKALASRSAALDPVTLFARVRWMLGLIGREPAFRFAQVLAQAPTFATWKKEKAMLAEQPELALYWSLAHAFLGNDDACREAATLAQKSGGHVVPELAATVLGYCDGKKASPIEGMSGDAFQKAKALVAKNALPAQLAVAPKASPLEEELRAHDEALKSLAKTDKAKAKAIDDYFRERSGEAYNFYAENGALPDWLVPAAAAAFRVGLAFDLGHPKAHAGISRALAGRADHPDARGALIATLSALTPADDRLGHAVDALVTRDEPDAREAIRAAAWRWLTEAKGIAEILAKRRERNSLDDLFAKDDKLKPAVDAVLARCDDEAEKLALQIADAQLGFGVLKGTVGLIYRLYGVRGIADRFDRMFELLGYLDLVPGNEDADEPGVMLDATASVAMAEAGIAIARLDPVRAKPRLIELLQRKRATDERQCGIAACVIPGILLVEPTHAKSLYWLERVLGSRGGEPWIYGGIAAVRDAKLAQAVPWVRPHAYTSQINQMMEQFADLESHARAALAALGAAAPPFSDEDASDLTAGKLGEALGRWDAYDKSSVLERIRDAKAKGCAPAVAAFLEDRVRFSKYTEENHFIRDDLAAAIGILHTYAKPELKRIRALPELGAWIAEMIDEAT